MIVSKPTPEKSAEWKRLYETYRPALCPNRRTGGEVEAYFRERYPCQPCADSALRNAVAANITENDYARAKLPSGAKPNPQCYRTGEVLVGIDPVSGEFHAEAEDMTKAIPIYDDLLAFRGVDGEDLENFVLVAEYVNAWKQRRDSAPKPKTERLFLREMTPQDFDALYTVLADSDIMEHYPYTFDEARVRGWIQKNIDRYRACGFGLWAVCLKATGEMIGDCGLTMQSINGTSLPEIGYHIAKAHQRKGYATEAARAVRDWSFANTPFAAVYSCMKKQNLPSAATARANGMQLQSEFTDSEGGQTVVYAISRAEWEKGRTERSRR